MLWGEQVGKCPEDSQYVFEKHLMSGTMPGLVQGTKEPHHRLLLSENLRGPRWRENKTRTELQSETAIHGAVRDFSCVLSLCDGNAQNEMQLLEPPFQGCPRSPWAQAPWFSPPSALGPAQRVLPLHAEPGHCFPPSSSVAEIKGGDIPVVKLLSSS